MRNSKIKLFELIDDMNTTVDMEEGGGLNDAYMTLSRRRRRPRSAFADPNATSAFADPNNPSAFIPDRFPVSSNKGGGLPTIYRFWGGDIGADYMDDLGGSEEHGGFDEYEDESISLTTEELTPTAETYTQDQLDQLSQAYAPSPQLSDLAADSELGYNAPEIAAIRDAQGAAAKRDEADRRSGFLEGTTRTVTDQRTSIPTKEEYERSLDKYGYEPWQTAYLNDLISKGYDINQAQSLVASAMATPGGIQGMKDAFHGSYSYGGPAGTLQYLLERGTMQSLGIEDILKKDKKRRAEDKYRESISSEEYPTEQESFLDRVGLGGIADKLTEIFSIQGEISPQTVTAMEEVLPEGAKFTPSGFMGTVMDYASPLIGKGLANMTDTGKTVGTIEIGDLSFNLNMTKDGARLSLNTPNTFDDSGYNVARTQRTPVKKAAPTAAPAQPEEKGIRRLLARRSDPKKRSETMASEQDIYERIYGRPFNIG